MDAYLQLARECHAAAFDPETGAISELQLTAATVAATIATAEALTRIATLLEQMTDTGVGYDGGDVRMVRVVTVN